MGVESWYFRKINFLNLWDLETLWYILESPSKYRLPPLHPTTLLGDIEWACELGGHEWAWGYCGFQKSRNHENRGCRVLPSQTRKIINPEWSGIISGAFKPRSCLRWLLLLSCLVRFLLFQSARSFTRYPKYYFPLFHCNHRKQSSTPQSPKAKFLGCIKNSLVYAEQSSKYSSHTCNHPCQ